MNKSQAIDVLRDYTDIMSIQHQLFNICKLDPSERVKRGPLQKQIATELDFVINPRFYFLLSKVIENLPVKEIKVQGISHYKGLALR